MKKKSCFQIRTEEAMAMCDFLKKQKKQKTRRSCQDAVINEAVLKNHEAWNEKVKRRCWQSRSILKATPPGQRNLLTTTRGSTQSGWIRPRLSVKTLKVDCDCETRVHWMTVMFLFLLLPQSSCLLLSCLTKQPISDSDADEAPWWSTRWWGCYWSTLAQEPMSWIRVWVRKRNGFDIRF